MRSKVVGYVRVSSEDQVNNYSLTTQEAYIKQEVERRDYELVKIFREEGKSAKTLERPALIDCLNFCYKNKSEIFSLIVYKLDRLSRQTSDYLAVRKQLAQYGIDLISISEPTGTNPAEKFIETVLAASAQLDNEVRASRAMDGLKARFESGLYLGKPPVGYTAVKNQVGRSIAVPDKIMFSKVRESWAVMESGTKTLSQIAKYMNNLDIRTFWAGRNFKFTKKSAGRIFRNKFYMGISESKRWGEIRGKHKPMITQESFWKVQAILDGRTVTPVGIRRLRIHPDFPLRRIVKCFNGHKLTGGWSKYHQYAYYFCPQRCTKSIPKDNIEKAIVKLLRKITPTQGTIEMFNLLLYEEYYERYTKLETKQKQAEKDTLELRQMMVKLVKGHTQGKYPDDVFDEMKAEFEHEMIAKQTILNESIIKKYDIDSVVNFSKAFLKDLAKPYIIGEPEQKITLISSIFPEGLTWKNNLFELPKLNSMFAYLSGQEPLGGTEGSRTLDFSRDRRAC